MIPRSGLIAAALLLGCGTSLPDSAELERLASSCAVATGVPVAGLRARATLLDAYYLQEATARDMRAGQAASPKLEETLAKASALDAAIVRTLGFNDDPAKAGDSAIQIAPLQYDETSFRALDVVLARAGQTGLKLVMPLGNFWDDYGGMRQYVTWAGLPSPVSLDPRFFTDRSVIDLYKAHVTNVLNRVNTVDGIRYGDHPAVLAWEILNEPRGTGLDQTGAALRAWIDELGATVKALSPAKLVSTGEEGFEGDGTSFALNAASPSVGLLSIHWYPEDWGYLPEDTASAGARWISSHAAVAAAAGKPLMIGEFGLRNAEGFTLEQRRAMYRGWFKCAWASGVAAAGPWMFAYDARPDEWDGYTWYFRDGTAPDDPVNRYADIFASGGQ
jgi:mannan endo-1,4-beta-mannosidase